MNKRTLRGAVSEGVRIDEGVLLVFHGARVSQVCSQLMPNEISDKKRCARVSCKGGSQTRTDV